MRDILVKLYVDDSEMNMILCMAKNSNQSVNEFLRELLYNRAKENEIAEANLFTRKTHRSKPRREK